MGAIASKGPQWPEALKILAELVQELKPFIISHTAAMSIVMRRGLNLTLRAGASGRDAGSRLESDRNQLQYCHAHMPRGVPNLDPGSEIKVR